MYNLSEISDELTEIGRHAAARQQDIMFTDRQLKEDGSILTEIDVEIQTAIIDLLQGWRPELGLLAEENDVADIQDPSTVVAVIDPIDGTDSFSQGMQTWAISIGLIDPFRGPIAGFVAAPRMGLYVIADEDGQISVDGGRVCAPDPSIRLDKNFNLCVSSRVHQTLELTRFPGKTRSFGSAALHLLWPALFPGVGAALQDAGTFIWDIGGVLAVTALAGYETTYLDGKPIDWRSLLSDPKTNDVVLVSSPAVSKELRALVRLRLIAT